MNFVISINLKGLFRFIFSL